MSEKFGGIISLFSRILYKIYSTHSQLMKNLAKYASRVGEWIGSLYIARFTGLQPWLTTTWFRSPKIKEELTLNLKVIVSRNLLRLIKVSKILSDIKSELYKSIHFIYEKSSIFGAVAPITALPPTPSAPKVYTTYPKAADAVSHKYANIIGFKRLTLALRVPLTAPQKFYEAAGAKIFEAASAFKSFGEGRPQRHIGVIEAASRAHRETEKFHGFLEDRLSGLIKLVKSPYQIPLYSVFSMMEKISESVAEKAWPTRASVGYYETKDIIYIMSLLSEVVKETFKLSVQRSSVTFNRAYIFAQKRTALPFYETYIPEPISSTGLRKTLKLLFYSLTTRLSRKTRWSEPLYKIHSKFYIQAYQKARRGGTRAASRMFTRNLLLPLSHKISKPLEVKENEEPTVLLEYTRTFLNVAKYPSMSQLFSLKMEYLHPITDFLGKMVVSSPIFPLTGYLAKSFLSGGFKEETVGFKAAERYAEVVGWALPYLMERYPTISRLTYEAKPVTSRVIKLTEHFGLMEKSLDAVSHLTSGVKATFSTVLPLKFYLERFVKEVSVTAYIYPAVGRPLFGSQTPYRGRVASFQLSRIHEVASILQMFSSMPPPSPERAGVQRPINITVRVESPADEDDLRELERKIVKILREEARRYGLNI